MVAGAFLLLAGIALPHVPADVSDPRASALVIALIAWPSLAALVRWQGAVRGVLSLALLSGYAYAIEWVGLRTGWPYGAFDYGPALRPLIAGELPLLLPPAYVPLVLGAAALVLRFRPPVRFPPRGADLVAWCGFGAAALLAMDGVIDPGAVHLGFWTYDDAGGFHGVPLSNYAGWAISGTVAMALFGVSLTSKPDPAGSGARGLATSAWLMVCLYTGVAVGAGMAVPAAIGLACAALLLYHMRAAAPARRSPSDPGPARPRSTNGQ